MRQIDIELIESVVEHFGPFEIQVVDCGPEIRCDFCYQQGQTKLVKLCSDKSDNRLHACLGGCDALNYFSTEQVLKRLLSPEWMPRQDIAAFVTETVSGNGIATAPPVTGTPTENLGAFVLKCKKAWAQGHGRTWKIIPSLFSQYDSKGRLSAKQLQVLDRYWLSVRHAMEGAST
jgi:hypothetical protein